MPDIFSPSKRSAIMAKIRSENSNAERIVFRYLRKEGIYFQKHYKKTFGSPDIALPRKKKAVFVDGDFWHGRHIERMEGREYWHAKLLSNIERDRRVDTELAHSGWQYLRVWESDIIRKSSQQNMLRAIQEFLTA